MLSISDKMGTVDSLIFLARKLRAAQLKLKKTD